MRGAGDAQRRAQEQALYTAWATERIAREDKLHGFAKYRDDMLPRAPKAKATPEELLARFRGLAAEGIPMTIKKVA